MVRISVILVIFISFCGGCRAWNKDMAVVGHKDISPSAAQRPTAVIEVQALLRSDEAPGPLRSMARVHAMKAIENSEMFTIAKPGAASDYTMRLTFSYDAAHKSSFDMSGAEWGNAVASGLTLFAFPVMLENVTQLHARVERNDAILKEYDYRQRTGMFGWTLVGVVGSAVHANSKTHEAVDNMTYTLLRDMQRDGILSGAGPVALPTPHLPPAGNPQAHVLAK